MDNNTEKKGLSHYNLNESDFLLLADLQREGFTMRNSKKNYPEALNRWKSVRMLIDARFEDTENEDLDKLEKEFWSKPKLQVPSNLSNECSFGDMSPRKIYIKQQYRIHKLRKLDLYITKIRQLMKDYKISMTDTQAKEKLD